MKKWVVPANFAIAAVLLAGWLAAPAGYGQSVTPGFTPTEQDFELPLQDLETRKGELIWLQGGLKRGDATPYRNPVAPLAAYEQGLLDAAGNLWTFLDNPKGRELRYNKLLRGKTVEVKGWFYDRTQIIEVFSWTDAQSHPVRSDTGYPEPIRIPFDSLSAETIEPIPPVMPEIPGMDLLGEDMWRIREGLELLDDADDYSGVVPESLEEGERLRQFIEEVQNGEGETLPIAPPSPPTDRTLPPAEPSRAPERLDLRTPDPIRSSPLPDLPRAAPSTSGDANSDGIERGLTEPEEMFDASRRALLE